MMRRTRRVLSQTRHSLHLAAACLAFASLAAVSPPAHAQLRDVDVELNLLVDVSGSISDSEFDLQRSGYASAFRDATVQSIIASHPQGIAVGMTYWSSSDRQSDAVPYALLTDRASASSFADAIESAARPFTGGTVVGAAIRHAASSLTTNAFDGDRLVIDVSGDGTSDVADTLQARSQALSSGVDTINGLTIGSSSIESFYRDNVIGGADPFVRSVSSFSDFADAIREKLSREIVDVPAQQPRPASGSEPAYHEYVISTYATGQLGVQTTELSIDLATAEILVFNGGPLHYEIPFELRFDEAFVFANAVRFAAAEGSLQDALLSRLDLPLSIEVTRTAQVNLAIGGTLGAVAEIQPGDDFASLSVDLGAGAGLSGEATIAELLDNSFINPAAALQRAFDTIPSGIEEVLENSKVRIGFSGDGGGVTLPLPSTWVDEPHRIVVGAHATIDLPVTLGLTMGVSLDEATGDVGEIPSLAASLGKSIDLAAGPYVTSTSGTISFADGPLLMTTGSPVWITSVVTVEDVVNALTFDLDFTSDLGAEGLLAVYWNGEVIGTVDERVTADAATSFILSLNQDFAPGTYQLAFRLDPYSAVASSVEIANVSAFRTVAEPDACVQSILLAAALLAIRPLANRAPTLSMVASESFGA